MLTHIDDFELVGTTEFVEEIISVVGKELTVSKVDEDVFRYTDLTLRVYQMELRSQWRTTPEA